jgi:hypothetical protein
MWHFSSLPAPLVCRQQFAYSLESSLPRSQRAYLPNITSVGLEVISPLHYTYNTTQALVILEATSYHNGRSAERRSTCSAQHILHVIASHLHLCERPAPSSTHQNDAHSVLRVSTIYASTFNIFGSEAFTARILVCGMPDMVHLSSAFEKARTWLTSTKLVCSFCHLLDGHPCAIQRGVLEYQITPTLAQHAHKRRARCISTIHHPFHSGYQRYRSYPGYDLTS